MALATAWCQGVATRSVRPTPRGKPSGLPFHARFVDVAAEAGLRAPVIYGEEYRKTYILETTGCGAAFLDYDNHGHTDVFLTYWGQNVLYRNLGDGTFADVTRASGLLDRRTRWGSGATFLDYDRDGDLAPHWTPALTA